MQCKLTLFALLIYPKCLSPLIFVIGGGILNTLPVRRLTLFDLFAFLGFSHNLFLFYRSPDDGHAVECFCALPDAASQTIHCIPLNLENTRVICVAILLRAMAFEEAIEPDMRHRSCQGPRVGAFRPSLQVHTDIISVNDDRLFGSKYRIGTNRFPEDGVFQLSGKLNRRTCSHLRCAVSTSVPAITPTPINLTKQFDRRIRKTRTLQPAPHNVPLLVSKSMAALDLLPIVHKPIHTHPDAIPQSINMNLAHLDLPLDIQSFLFRPPLHVPQPAQLTGDGYALAPTRPHPPFGKPAQGRVKVPPLLRNQICARGSPTPSLPRLAMYHHDPLPTVLPPPPLPLSHAIGLPKPIPHAGQDVRQQRKRRRMMIGPGKMEDAV